MTESTTEPSSADDPTALLRGAVADAAPNYAQVTADQLELTTPCDGWDLRTLLNHVYSRMTLSTRAARLEPTENFAMVEIDYVGDDPSGAFERLTTDMLAAWAACDDFTSERVTPLGPIPAEAVLLFGAQDVFIHAWDVAKTLGVAPQLSPEMVDVFTQTHRQSVDEQTRAMFFDPEVPVPADASALDKLVGFLGRRP